MDVDAVTAALGMGPGEIMSVRDTVDGVVATDRDGWDLLVTGAGVVFYGRGPHGHVVFTPTEVVEVAPVLLADGQPDPDTAPAREIRDWVGDDPGRARAALAAEVARADGPRSTLLRDLERLGG